MKITDAMLFELRLPILPNFISVEGGERPSIDVADISDTELRKLGAQWTEALVEKARRRAKARTR